jgi:pimeloyl-ACP methyl ester carboxylesterase
MLRAPIHNVVAVTAALATTAGLALAGAAAATTDRTSAPKPTIVLVHGAFAESASWNGVVARLQRRGYPVVSAANPLRGLHSDAAYLRRLLSTIDGPVVLAGHSYGGSVITNAATGAPDVKALVYVAAFAPAKGETALELSGKYPGSTLGETLTQVPLDDGSSDLYIRRDLYRRQFAADLTRREAAILAATQRPIRDTALGEASGTPAWARIPSWFVLAGADLNIPIAAQRFMADRAGSRGTVEVPRASHSVGVSQPKVVADQIVRAATTR